MVKALSFKGDKKVKKRKHKEVSSSSIANEGRSADQDPDAESEESWTTADRPSDLSGPIMILLPETQDVDSDNPSLSKPSCLASDATGAVFASPVENVIPDTAARLCAEPSDVRQVWVVTKVPGENSGWTLKSHQGRYLSADQFGLVRCEREAAGMEEVFWFAEAEKYKTEDADTKEHEERRLDGAFHVYTSRETYLSASLSGSKNSRQLEVRADDKTPTAASVLYIRMQARFKPRLKATKELKEKEKISRKQLEEAVGRKLDEDEVRRLKKARREGGWHEAVLDARVKSRHDKFA